ncbi:MAG: helix-hairpin-helix domain-containing protein [Gemmatimonadales bacterium]|jgi:competence protein ComEA
MTEGEVKALLASALLVILSALGRLLLSPDAAEVSGEGLRATGGLDSALAVAESAYSESERRREPLGEAERIDPNSASEIELDRLPGVGPALARSIVRSRERDGPFRSLDDLRRVPGLGAKKVEQLAAHTALAAVDGRRGSLAGGDRLRGSGSMPRHERVNLNRATAEELEILPGIGPAKASAIVRWRSEHGRFRKLEDVLGVPGIGPATLERLRALVVVRP